MTSVLPTDLVADPSPGSPSCPAVFGDAVDFPHGGGSAQGAEDTLDPPPVRSMEGIDGMAVADAIAQIHRSLDEKDILEATVQGLRSLLAVDRVCTLQFEQDSVGTMGVFVAESVGAPW